MIEILVLFAVFAAAAIYEVKWGMFSPKPYNARKCMGKEWRTAFPDAHKDEIRKFLSCLVDGMAFRDSEKLKFQPNDQVIDIYKAIYGGRVPLADSLECETFFLNLTREFEDPESRLSSVWHENVSLGELFEAISAQQGAQTPTPQSGAV